MPSTNFDNAMLGVASVPDGEDLPPVRVGPLHRPPSHGAPRRRVRHEQ